MRLACRYAFPLAIVSVVSLVAQAHPGHTHEVVPATSAWHYWLQPEHAMFTWVLSALPIVFFLAASRRWLSIRRAQHMTPLLVARHHGRCER